MKHPVDITITPRDRLLRAWENSMELVRDFECYANEIQDTPEIAEVFQNFAVEEGLHAAKFRELLLAME
ncbi:MAG: rubrerythrin [Clostridia bacterium]|nr:rubrerythrin [Clostridia bacterium]